MPYVAAGSGMSLEHSFYLGPDPALGKGGPVEFHHHDSITDKEYDTATPETKRLIDNLVERNVLLKVTADAVKPATGEGS